MGGSGPDLVGGGIADHEKPIPANTGDGVGGDDLERDGADGDAQIDSRGVVAWDSNRIDNSVLPMGHVRQQKTDSLTTSNNKNGDLIMYEFYFFLIAQIGLIAIGFIIGWLGRGYFAPTLRTVADEVKKIAATIYDDNGSAARQAKIENDS
ncbi:hypothetical protein KS4_18250 [Poriferisphaera corsica]|uniref:Uncharacterized protein n=1 Tax=Poriferisphaera corsica TaxID=2528020 RepID=A0A517YU63_9BACT|nr:hypothetical protein KS4_18250 [Poriferisphaera corsica]